MINTRKAKLWACALLAATTISTAGALAPSALANPCTGGMCKPPVNQVAR
jgi:hypothetical protein